MPSKYQPQIGPCLVSNTGRMLSRVLLHHKHNYLWILWSFVHPDASKTLRKDYRNSTDASVAYS